MSWHPHDRQAAAELSVYDGEACPRGHHPSIVDRYAPVWMPCGLCRLIEEMERAGPPGPGNYIALVSHEEAERRARLRAELLADDD